MKHRSLYTIISGLGLAVVYSLLSGCGDYSVHLPGGYFLVQVYPGAVLIDHVDRPIAIDANVDGYKVYGKLVVGHVSTPKPPPEYPDSIPGYFILNTETHEVNQGLEKQVWLNSLRILGITSEPSLSKPSRFDRDYQ